MSYPWKPEDMPELGKWVAAVIEERSGPGGVEDFQTWLRSVKADTWDQAVASLVYEDGTPLEVVKNINPYREADG